MLGAITIVAQLSGLTAGLGGKRLGKTTVKTSEFGKPALFIFLHRPPSFGFSCEHCEHVCFCFATLHVSERVSELHKFADAPP
jgi:hypothetical protein